VALLLTNLMTKVGRQHTLWGVRSSNPLSRHRTLVPEPSVCTRDTAWSQSEIDRFVQSAAEAGIIPVLQVLLHVLSSVIQ
jgi:hypothetical protein